MKQLPAPEPLDVEFELVAVQLDEAIKRYKETETNGQNTQRHIHWA